MNEKDILLKSTERKIV
jgi:predicted  nucleic acid-binding Zn-ribbon protein